MYGFGDEYLINTQKEFHVTIRMVAPSGIITQVEIILEQGSHKIGQTYKQPFDGYYEQLSKELQTKQNVFVVSAWTGSMDWLDTPPCPQPTPPTSAAYIKDIVISSL